jgi:hypothetical protein
MKEFFSAFPQKKKAAANSRQEDAPAAKATSPSSETSDSELGLSVSAWSDICKGLFPREMVTISSDLSYELRVRGAVSKFLESRVARLGLELSDCLKEPTGSSKTTFAIPLVLEGEFIAWFRNQIPNRFETSPRNSSASVKALETSQSGASTKRKRAIRIDSDEEDEQPLPEPDMGSINLLLEQLCDLPMETTDLLEQGTSNLASKPTEEIPEIFAPERPPSPLWSFPWLNENHDHGNVAAALADSPTKQTTGADNGIDPAMFEMSSPEIGTVQPGLSAAPSGSESETAIIAQDQDEDIVLTPDSTPIRAPHKDIGVDAVHLSSKLAKVLFASNESENDADTAAATISSPKLAHKERSFALEELDARDTIQEEQSTVSSEELSSSTIPMTIEDVDAAMAVQETMTTTAQEKASSAEPILIDEETSDGTGDETPRSMQECSRSESPILIEEGEVEQAQEAGSTLIEDTLIEKLTASEVSPACTSQEDAMQTQKDVTEKENISETPTSQDFVPETPEKHVSISFSSNSVSKAASKIQDASVTPSGMNDVNMNSPVDEAPASQNATAPEPLSSGRNDDAAEDTDNKGQKLTRYNT